MKTIKVLKKNITVDTEGKIVELAPIEISVNLDIGEELRVKDLRKMQPILNNRKEGEEIEMIIAFIKAFSVDENIEAIIDDLGIEAFTKLGEEVTKLFNVSGDKKKS